MLEGEMFMLVRRMDDLERKSSRGVDDALDERLVNIEGSVAWLKGATKELQRSYDNFVEPLLSRVESLEAGRDTVAKEKRLSNKKSSKHKAQVIDWLIHQILVATCGEQFSHDDGNVSLWIERRPKGEYPMFYFWLEAHEENAIPTVVLPYEAGDGSVELATGLAYECYNTMHKEFDVKIDLLWRQE